MKTAIIIITILLLLILVGIVIYIFKKKSDEEVVYNSVRNPLVMQILVPRENEKAALAAEQMFASIHGILGAIRDVRML